jgi:hypothetical protein
MKLAVKYQPFTQFCLSSAPSVALPSRPPAIFYVKLLCFLVS